MKEFEKWWKENGCSIIGVKSYSEFVWKAALEWAKAMWDKSSTPRFAVNIKEELENE